MHCIYCCNAYAVKQKSRYVNKMLNLNNCDADFTVHMSYMATPSGIVSHVEDAMPWYRKNSYDVQSFKRDTMYRTCVMGRRTFDRLPCLLKNREHIVLCSEKNASRINNEFAKVNATSVDSKVHAICGDSALANVTEILIKKRGAIIGGERTIDSIISGICENGYSGLDLHQSVTRSFISYTTVFFESKSDFADIADFCNRLFSSYSKRPEVTHVCDTFGFETTNGLFFLKRVQNHMLSFNET